MQMQTCLRILRTIQTDVFLRIYVLGASQRKGFYLRKRRPGMVGSSPIYGRGMGSGRTARRVVSTLFHVTRGNLFQAISVVSGALAQGVGV